MTDRAWILVTGSRDFRDYRLVATVLNSAWHDATQDGHLGLTIVHGAAAGADSLAEQWWERHQRFGVQRDRFPADWDAECLPECPPTCRRTRVDGSSYCRGEGRYRNRRMIEHVKANAAEGSVLVVAFFSRPDSKGTLNCCRQAKAAGFPVRAFGVPPVEFTIVTPETRARAQFDNSQIDNEAAVHLPDPCDDGTPCLGSGCSHQRAADELVRLGQDDPTDGER